MTGLFSTTSRIFARNWREAERQRDALSATVSRRRPHLAAADGRAAMQDVIVWASRASATRSVASCSRTRRAFAHVISIAIPGLRRCSGSFQTARCTHAKCCRRSNGSSVERTARSRSPRCRILRTGTRFRGAVLWPIFQVRCRDRFVRARIAWTGARRDNARPLVRAGAGAVFPPVDAILSLNQGDAA